MSQSSFHRTPPEIWEKVFEQVGRRDLANLALTSREMYPSANRLLYKTIEVSFCKCSEAYYNALARTVLNNPDLTALIAHLLIDMKVPCRVKTASSVDNIQAARSWTNFRPYVILSGMIDYGRYSDPKGQADWSREAVQTLVNPQFFDILSKLRNLEKVTVILGHYQQTSTILSSLLDMLPANVLPSLQYLKVYDASLVATPSPTRVSSLCVLDLGYVTVDNAELCALVSRNAGSLEEIRLQWIMEPSQTALFAHYSGDAVRNIKAFVSQGPYIFSRSGLQALLGKASSFEELCLESHSVPSATVWSNVIADLIEDDNWRAEQMRVLKFGASTGCKEFWDSSTKLLRRCGNLLTCLSINGSSRGSIGPFPPDLLTYFSTYSQPHLSALVLMWRDDAGFSPESASTLSSFAPSLEMFHACLRFPANIVDTLLNMIAPFKRLRRTHFTFLKYAHVQSVHQARQYSTVYEDKVNNIVSKGPIFDAFIQQAVIQHPELREVSWGVYDRVTYSGDGPKAYINRNLEIADANRTKDAPEKPSYTLEDLGEECRKFGAAETPRFRCTVGTRKVLLNQKPSWREDMGNPFLESHSICMHAEFNTGVGVRPRRRAMNCF